MDGYSGYNQVKMVEENKKKTSFISEWGAYAYNSMPFGLCNAPTTFQKLITQTFQEYLNNFIQVFLDDFNVYGQKVEDLNHLKKSMTQCKNNGISFNLEKCAFCVNLGVLLRHIIYEDGLLVDLRKINIITEMPTPTNVTKLKRILRAASFYQRYFKKVVAKVALMCKLLKDTHYWWDNACKKSFQWMKPSLTTLPILIALDWTREFHVNIDASNYAIGTMLVQTLMIPLINQFDMSTN
jgi:hypothetical protein